jgi:lipopolysaccharide transport system ATP-binding protein
MSSDRESGNVAQSHRGTAQGAGTSSAAPPLGHSAASSSDLAVRVAGVSKFYQIYDKPRDRLKQAMFGAVRTFYRPFWALHHVSFEVGRGEAVGIVGRNGSGKSTLLQIIAGTLTPTEGQVHVRGRVAALLELGSGFNPEFTGRENVFLQGAILGIPRREMQARFDDIATFADVGDFLDQPVKHYSSGMHARLAFSVAVSVDPDILIVDEVLAVGDMGFQQKCVARMRRLLDSGVTLLYVSHSPDSVKSICRRALYLEGGRAVCFGDAGEVVDRYVADARLLANEVASRQATALATPVPLAAAPRGALRYGSGQAQIEHTALLDPSGRPVSAFVFGEPITIEVAVRAHAPIDRLDVTFGIRDAAGVDLTGSGTAAEGVELPALDAGQRLIVRFRLDNCLRAGAYGVFATLTRMPESADHYGVTLDHIDAAAPFQSVGGAKWVVHKFYVPVSITVASAAYELATGAQ